MGYCCISLCNRLQCNKFLPLMKCCNCPQAEAPHRASCTRREQSDMSWKSKLLTYVVILLQLGSGILAFMAMVTKYWGVIPSESAHFGLSTLCTKYEHCVSGTINGADDVQNLLATVFGLGSVCALTCGIMELIRTFACFALLGGFSCFLALLGFAAMVHAVVVLNSAFGSLYQLSWSYAVGWMSVLSAAISAVLSFYLCWTKPKTTESSASAPTAIQTVAEVLQYPAMPNEWIVPPKV